MVTDRLGAFVVAVRRIVILSCRSGLEVEFAATEGQSTGSFYNKCASLVEIWRSMMRFYRATSDLAFHAIAGRVLLLLAAFHRVLNEQSAFLQLRVYRLNDKIQ